MPTSPTDPIVPAEGEEAARLRVVPGDEVAIHWLDLAEGLAPAQAAAAARLMLADASAAPLADMHVAVGRPEAGLTPVALVPNARMEEWIASDPDIILPSPFLLLPPDEGFVRRTGEGAPDYRGLGAAFSVEPELAEMLTGDAAVVEADQAMLDAGLMEALAAPALNLRQGPFAKRRQYRIEQGYARRIATYAAALGAISLLVPIAAIFVTTFSADRIEAETAALAQSGSAGGAPASAAPRSFGPIAALLFEAIRSTPNAELVRLDYRADGSLAASFQVDNAATFAALRARAEASGLRIEAGPVNGRNADLVARLS